MFVYILFWLVCFSISKILHLNKKKESYNLMKYESNLILEAEQLKIKIKKKASLIRVDYN